MQKAECHSLTCAHGVVAQYMSGVTPLRGESRVTSACASTHPHLSWSCQFDFLSLLDITLMREPGVG